MHVPNLHCPIRMNFQQYKYGSKHARIFPGLGPTSAAITVCWQWPAPYKKTYILFLPTSLKHWGRWVLKKNGEVDIGFLIKIHHSVTSGTNIILFKEQIQVLFTPSCSYVYVQITVLGTTHHSWPGRGEFPSWSQFCWIATMEGDMHSLWMSGRCCLTITIKLRRSRLPIWPQMEFTLFSECCSSPSGKKIEYLH